MKFRNTHDSFRTILKIVVGVMFALALVAISFKAATTSREDRSKAAEIQRIYKSWEFDGATTEGWLSTNLLGMKVAGGMLTSMITDTPVTLTNKAVSTVLPIGNKYINVRLAVSNSHQSLSAPKIPLPNEKSMNMLLPTVSPYMISVGYMVNGGSRRELSPVTGKADGNFYEYTMRMPDINGLTIDSMQFVLSSVRPGMVVQIDWVRVLASPIPTPSPVCKVGVNSFSVESPCSPDYKTARYVTYQCYDGSGGRLGNGMCQPVDVLNKQAQDICQKRTNCPPPTPACYYKQIECIKAPCPTITVCPPPTITPTKTPTPPSPPPITPTSTPTCVTSCDTNGRCQTICYQPVSPTPTLGATCNYNCSLNSDCSFGLVCYSRVCRNPSCTGQTNCICPTGPTSTPTTTPIGPVVATYTPTPTY